VIDQGSFSAANFLMSILLARWLSETSYGAFTITFSIYIFVSTVQGALILEPMSVYGVKKYEDGIQSYLATQIRYQLQINVIISALLLIVSFFMPVDIRIALIGCAFSLPLTLLFWLFRRACYIRMETHIAAILSFAYAVIVLLGLFVLSKAGLISAFSAFLLLGVASALTSIAGGWILRVSLKAVFSEAEAFFFVGSGFHDNWNFGKWILVSFLSDNVSTLFYPIILGSLLGLERTAGFRSAQNLLLPLQQLQALITLITIPWMSRVKKTKPALSLRTDGWPVIVSYLLVGILYILPIVIFAKPIMNIVYGNSFYTSYSWLIGLLSIPAILYSFNLSLAVLYKAVEFTEPLLLGKVASAITVVITAWIFVSRLGIVGIFISLLLSTIVEGIVLFLCLKQNRAMIY
jgi:O-antigen/teichoic acid export membrane protein